MSSEALREAKVWLEQLASADRELVRTSGLAAALLAEVARLEQERDAAKHQRDNFERIARERAENAHVNLQARGAAEAALAVARERAEKAERERDESTRDATELSGLYLTHNRRAEDLADELAVAREREQPMREALQACVGVLSALPRSARSIRRTQVLAMARAALVDEPAAAAMPRVTHGGRASVDAHRRARAALPGSASGAADEPGETP